MSAPESPSLDAARTIGEEDRDGLPGILRAMARDIGDRLERIDAHLQALPRIEAAIVDLNRRVLELERSSHRRDDRLDHHDKRITALEAAKKTARRKARK